MVFRVRSHKLCVLALLFVVFTGIYVTYFLHPPADVLIQMNKHIDSDRQDFNANFHKHHIKGASQEAADGGDRISENVVLGTVKGADNWEHFIKNNNFVAIGAVYNKCDGERTQIGTVILEEDKERGGVQTRTFLNITLDQQLEGGQFHFQVKYNGRDLYENYWEICDLEESLRPENRTIICPLAAGMWSKQKVKHMPSYLPSGRYQTKAWAVDEENRMIGCGFSDFQI